MKPMCGLAIEAATEQFSLAACRGPRIEVLDLQPARDHSQRIYQHLQRLLDAVGADLGSLDFVAFGCGPGSFTGVRIAAAAAQALAFARSIPVCRASSLAVLAAGAGRLLGPGRYAVCQDARMGQAYVALYEVGPAGEASPRPLLADALVDPRGWSVPGSDPFIALGSGWQAFPDLPGRHGDRVLSVEDGLLPSARDLLSMAHADFLAGRTVAADEALPEYLGQVPAGRGAGGKA